VVPQPVEKIRGKPSTEEGSRVEESQAWDNHEKVFYKEGIPPLLASNYRRSSLSGELSLKETYGHIIIHDAS